jgi:hypothetical protein
MKRSVSLVVFASIVAVLAMLGGRSMSAQTPDPLLGTWKMDIAKSKFNPGPAAKSSTAIFAAAGSGLKATIDTVPGTGDKTAWGYTAQYDGKDAKVTGTNPDADTIVMKRVSSHVTESVYKKGGKVTLTNSRTVSADGKTLTVTQTGTNAKGEKVNNVLVYTKG